MTEPVPPVSALIPGLLAETARGIERRIQFAFPPTKFQFRFMPAKLTSRSFSELYQGSQPLIALGWNGMTDMADGREFSGISTWTLMIAVKTAGASSQVRYLGDGVGPGLLNFVPAMIACLHGLTIEDIGTVAVKKASNAYAEDWGDDVAIAMFDLVIGATIPVFAAVTKPEDLGEFKKLGETWILPASGGSVPTYESELVIRDDKLP